MLTLHRDASERSTRVSTDEISAVFDMVNNEAALTGQMDALLREALSAVSLHRRWRAEEIGDNAASSPGTTEQDVEAEATPATKVLIDRYFVPAADALYRNMLAVGVWPVRMVPLKSLAGNTGVFGRVAALYLSGISDADIDASEAEEYWDTLVPVVPSHHEGYITIMKSNETGQVQYSWTDTTAESVGGKSGKKKKSGPQAPGHHIWIRDPGHEPDPSSGMLRSRFSTLLRAYQELRKTEQTLLHAEEGAGRPFTWFVRTGPRDSSLSSEARVAEAEAQQAQLELRQAASDMTEVARNMNASILQQRIAATRQDAADEVQGEAFAAALGRHKAMLVRQRMGRATRDAMAAPTPEEAQLREEAWDNIIGSSMLLPQGFRPFAGPLPIVPNRELVRQARLDWTRGVAAALGVSASSLGVSLSQGRLVDAAAQREQRQGVLRTWRISLRSILWRMWCVSQERDILTHMYTVMKFNMGLPRVQASKEEDKGLPRTVRVNLKDEDESEEEEDDDEEGESSPKRAKPSVPEPGPLSATKAKRMARSVLLGNGVWTPQTDEEAELRQGLSPDDLVFVSLRSVERLVRAHALFHKPARKTDKARAKQQAVREEYLSMLSAMGHRLYKLVLDTPAMLPYAQLRQMYVDGTLDEESYRSYMEEMFHITALQYNGSRRVDAVSGEHKAHSARAVKRSASKRPDTRGGPRDLAPPARKADLEEENGRKRSRADVLAAQLLAQAELEEQDE